MAGAWAGRAAALGSPGVVLSLDGGRAAAGLGLGRLGGLRRRCWL